MIKKAILILVLSFLIYRGFYLSLKLGFFRHIFNYHPKNCNLIPEFTEGSEDIEIIPGDKAFVSSEFGKGGSIYLLDLNGLKKGEYKTTKLQIKLKDGRTDLPYMSHGLSVWVHPSSGVVYLYAVNHYGGKETVEKLRFYEEKSMLVHEKTFSSSSFHVLNDLHVIEEDVFFFTNWLYSGNPYEIPLDLHWGSVGLYNAKLVSQDKGTLIATNLNSPNGIVANNKYLFVSEAGNENILIYNIGSQYSTTFYKSIKANMAVDNLSIDPATQDLVMAGHPIIFKAFLHLKMKTSSSPSMALRLKLNFKEDGGLEVGKTELLFCDDGDFISASSIAQVLKGNALLVGSVDDKLVYCSM